MMTHTQTVDEQRFEWMIEAACLGMDPDTFFPERGESSPKARRVCGGCAVRAECLDHALRFGERHGIWGGTTERERRPLRARLSSVRP